MSPYSKAPTVGRCPEAVAQLQTRGFNCMRATGREMDCLRLRIPLKQRVDAVTPLFCSSALLPPLHELATGAPLLAVPKLIMSNGRQC